MIHNTANLTTKGSWQGAQAVPNQYQWAVLIWDARLSDQEMMRNIGLQFSYTFSWEASYKARLVR